MENHKISFLKELKSIEDEHSYFEVFLGYLISPVITGIKPSSTISFKNDLKNSYSNWKKYGQVILDKYKLNSITLKEDVDGILLLIYDEENLKDHINISHHRSFLCTQGYGENFDLHKCIDCLRCRINQEDFPHESGIFMGIPLEDVLGFLKNDNCIFQGPWRVYEKEERSKEVFDLYEKSRELYILNKQTPSEIKNKFTNKRKKLYLAI